MFYGISPIDCDGHDEPIRVLMTCVECRELHEIVYGERVCDSCKQDEADERALCPECGACFGDPGYGNMCFECYCEWQNNRSMDVSVPLS